ncbi:M23 family metallopeptidase [uncultured Rikenella sp.]|uniref:M23 family metallopeptidase n=1 Tax=uncultured Rikenella sp. TaxID=368003 RepID=UPI00272AAE85|nr:M23 family metallopeptidase [uncultured Rikenella sp.]
MRLMLRGGVLSCWSFFLLILPVVSKAQSTGEKFGTLERRVDSLLRQAPSAEYFLKVVNLIRWDSRILTSIPSISPVRIAETRNIAHAISSPFGSRIHPIFHTQHAHSGIDIPGKERDTIYAAGSGVVAAIGVDDKLGGFIRIQHDYGLVSVYGHMRKALCQAEDTVRIGEPIGLMGSTGNSTGPHLHYSVKFRETFTDPIPFCYLMFDYLKRASRSEKVPFFSPEDRL